jgi:predicted AAA+ superfamily ATPase
MTYTARIADTELAGLLSSTGVVLIEGPKACGKTETARQRAASEVLLDIDDAARSALLVAPTVVLNGAAPQLVDEWQLEAKAVWNNVRRLVDDRKLPGQFILTGSAVPDDDADRHTGAGRFATLLMRPMSLYESGHSNGAISLRDLLFGAPPASPEPGLTVADLTEIAATGGWPANQQLGAADAARANRSYLDQIRNVDVERLAGERRDPVKLRRLMMSLARNVATEVNVKVLAADAGGDEGPLSRTTVYDYLAVLERLMIIEDQPAWNPHMRSKAQLRSSPKRHFIDPSLAVAALRGSAARLLADLNLFGLIYESLVVRDLRILAQPLDGEVYHYRDNYGLEIDAIVQLASGEWGAFEVKLGGEKLIDEGASSLLRFAEQIDAEKSGPPAVLAVIVATGYGYVRDDGVAVVPIGALAP